jgi:hypothetical protein
MAPVFTLYKFRKLFGLVVVIFILLSISSVIKPKVENAQTMAVRGIDSTGQLSGMIGAVNDIPDPEGSAKQETGNFLMNLLNEYPIGFFLLAGIVTIGLFMLGVRLTSVRSFLRALKLG